MVVTALRNTYFPGDLSLNQPDNPNTPEETELASKVLALYEASFLAKTELGLYDDMETQDKYYRGVQVEPESPDDPASNTNIIRPAIESQVADLVEAPLDIVVRGREPSDHMFAGQAQTLVSWVYDNNNMIIKRDRHERTRLKYGTSGWKVYYNKSGNNGRGKIEILERHPKELFPDPKVSDSHLIQEGDFFGEASFKSLQYLVTVFGDKAKAVKPNPYPSFSPNIFDGERIADISQILSERALLIEMWLRETDGYLRLVHIAEGVVLQNVKTKYKKFPYVLVPCYPREGIVWGSGDIDDLAPVQDLINDLDDQIRMNARLMGNLQIVVGVASGINLRKWTNMPGLKVPARNEDAWRQLQPASIPAYIPLRREKGFQEAELVTGRSDAVEGRNPGSVRAASAIVALQEAGSRRVNHKKLMAEQGLQEVAQLVLELAKVHFTREMAFRVIGPSQASGQEFLWFNPSRMQAIPRLVPDPIKQGELMPLLGGGGGQETKDAEMDITFSIGSGLPNNKAFIYQMTLELFNAGLITREEGRTIMAQFLRVPAFDPLMPQGVFAGRNIPGGMDPNAPEMQGANGNQNGAVAPPGSLDNQMQNQVPPDQQALMALAAMLGGRAA